MMRPYLTYCRSSIPGISLGEQIALAREARVTLSLDLTKRDMNTKGRSWDRITKNMFCPTVIAYDTHGQNLVSDPAAYRRFIPHFIDIIHAARRVRCRGILVALYEKKTVRDDDAIRFYMRLANLVPHGIKIYLEALTKKRTSFYPSVIPLLKFWQELSPKRFGFVVDTWHMHESEKDLYKSLSRIIPYASAIHLKDTQGLAPGEGDLDWKRIRRIITKAQYSGELLVECKTFKSKRAFLDHTTFMKKFWRV